MENDIAFILAIEMSLALFIQSVAPFFLILYLYPFAGAVAHLLWYTFVLYNLE